jgi:exonuclease III
MNPNKLTIAWWNTSLSPRSKPDRGSASDRNFACGVVASLVSDYDADVVVLSEVSRADLDFFRCELEAMGIYMNVVPELSSDDAGIGLLFRSGKLDVALTQSRTVTRLGRNFRLANEYCLILGDRPNLTILASHWPSRLQAEAVGIRALLGVRLRDAISEITNENDTQIIMVGDYNDEPFDASIADNLMATRDFDHAMRKRLLLFNPFWTQMGRVVSNPTKPLGTYYHCSGEVTKWRTFDQIIFTSSFLGQELWRLDEGSVQIGDLAQLRARIVKRREVFDHLPVLATVRN